MIDIPLWVAVSALAYFMVLPWAWGIAVLTVILVFLVPGWRRVRTARIVAWAACGFAVAITLIASPMLAQAFQDDVVTPIHQARLRRYSGDHSRRIAGIDLPPQSFVQLDDDKNVIYGHVSKPTDVYGLPVVGDFAIDGGSYSPGGEQPYVDSGTLAEPFTWRGVPCAAARFDISDIGTITCTLAHDAVLFGIPLRGGSKVSARVGRDDKPSIRSGFLGRPCTYFGIDWPAGTKVETDSSNATVEILQGTKPGAMMLTLPEGATRTVAGRIVHAGIPIPFDGGKPDLSMLDVFLRD